MAGKAAPAVGDVDSAAPDAADAARVALSDVDGGKVERLSEEAKTSRVKSLTRDSSLR